MLLIACNKDDSEVPEDKISQMTVLVYIAGENYLSSYIYDELKEMREGSKGIYPEDNFVVYVDNASTFTKPYLIRLKNGVTVDSVSMEESLSSDPEVLKRILNKTMTDYPAREYGLVLWGHASGWFIKSDSIAYTQAFARRKAYGVDNGQNSNLIDSGKWINMWTLSKVIESIGQKLKFIFADCCQFQCVESAYQLRNCCDYIIASPAEIPAAGAPYNTIVPAMFNRQPTFYQLMADAYFAQTINGKKEPISVIKTSEMQNLALATKTVLTTIVPRFEKATNPDLNGLIYYQGSEVSGQKNMFDMNDFILKYAEADEYDTWKLAFDRAVIYRTPVEELNGIWMSNGQINFRSFTITEERFGGMSMFIPQQYYTWSSIINHNITIRSSWYYAAGYQQVGW
jgi:hypothetical protein